MSRNISPVVRDLARDLATKKLSAVSKSRPIVPQKTTEHQDLENQFELAELANQYLQKTTFGTSLNDGNIIISERATNPHYEKVKEILTTAHNHANQKYQLTQDENLNALKTRLRALLGVKETSPGTFDPAEINSEIEKITLADAAAYQNIFEFLAEIRKKYTTTFPPHDGKAEAIKAFEDLFAIQSLDADHFKQKPSKAPLSDLSKNQTFAIIEGFVGDAAGQKAASKKIALAQILGSGSARLNALADENLKLSKSFLDFLVELRQLQENTANNSAGPQFTADKVFGEANDSGSILDLLNKSCNHNLEKYSPPRRNDANITPLEFPFNVGIEKWSKDDLFRQLVASQYPALKDKVENLTIDDFQDGLEFAKVIFDYKAPQPGATIADENPIEIDSEKSNQILAVFDAVDKSSAQDKFAENLGVDLQRHEVAKKIIDGTSNENKKTNAAESYLGPAKTSNIITTDQSEKIIENLSLFTDRNKTFFTTGKFAKAADLLSVFSRSKTNVTTTYGPESLEELTNFNSDNLTSEAEKDEFEEQKKELAAEIVSSVIKPSEYRYKRLFLQSFVSSIFGTNIDGPEKLGLATDFDNLKKNDPEIISHKEKLKKKETDFLAAYNDYQLELKTYTNSIESDLGDFSSSFSNAGKQKIVKIRGNNSLNTDEKTRELTKALSKTSTYERTSDKYGEIILRTLGHPHHDRIHKVNIPSLLNLLKVESPKTTASVASPTSSIAASAAPTTSATPNTKKYTLTFSDSESAKQFYSEINAQYSADRDKIFFGQLAALNDEKLELTFDNPNLPHLDLLCDRLNTSSTRIKESKRQFESRADKTPNRILGTIMNAGGLAPIVPLTCFAAGWGLQKIHSAGIPIISDFASAPARMLLSVAETGIDHGHLWPTTKKVLDEKGKITGTIEPNWLGKRAQDCREMMIRIDQREKELAERNFFDSPISAISGASRAIRNLAYGSVGTVANVGSSGLNLIGDAFQMASDKAFDQAKKGGTGIKAINYPIGAICSAVANTVNAPARALRLVGSALSDDCSAYSRSDKGSLTGKWSQLINPKTYSSAFNQLVSAVNNQHFINRETTTRKDLFSQIDDKVGNFKISIADNHLDMIRDQAAEIFKKTKSAKFEYSGIRGDERMYFKAAEISFDGRANDILYSPLDGSIAIVSKFKDLNSSSKVNEWNKLDGSRANQIIEALGQKISNQPVAIDQNIRITQSKENGISFEEFTKKKAESKIPNKAKKTSSTTHDEAKKHEVEFVIGGWSHKAEFLDGDVKIFRKEGSVFTKLDELQAYEIVNKAFKQQIPSNSPKPNSGKSKNISSNKSIEEVLKAVHSHSAYIG